MESEELGNESSFELPPADSFVRLISCPVDFQVSSSEIGAVDSSGVVSDLFGETTSSSIPLPGDCGANRQDLGDTVDLTEQSDQIHVDDCNVVDECNFFADDECAAVDTQTWNSMVVAGFAEYRSELSSLAFPWETGASAAVFRDDIELALPTCAGIAEQPQAKSAFALVPGLFGQDVQPLDDSAKYIKAVKNYPDLEYFADKSSKLELACGLWLNILSLDWTCSGVGRQVATLLQRDSTGVQATECLKAAFGVKSPSTLLKRAGAMKKFIRWHDTSGYGADTGTVAFPIEEEAVWEYFLAMKRQRQENQRGFTVQTSFLETIRFSKFTLDLEGTDRILSSRRLLGFAAIEKRDKGPTRQAPGLELVHMKQLHSILEGTGNVVDRLGAGVFLCCLYGRARWSDIRYISHVSVEDGRQGTLTLFTTEHKTASVGLRREQYLPLVIPSTGVAGDEWLQTFLAVYTEAGLDIKKEPLGPLMPAPKLGGGFHARPLSTTEAGEWLRGLLQGTPDASSFRSHSLKASLIIWSARAGLDKETRAVLAHHCSAVSGSEVVYSRHLQTRAIRKLSMMIKRVRIGLGLEDDNMREFGMAPTPVPFTPCLQPWTPAANPKTPFASAEQVETTDMDESKDVLARALDEVHHVNDVESVKEELFDIGEITQAAESLTLFPSSLVSAGVVEIESSSGSESSSSSESSSDLAPEESAALPWTEPKYSEQVPSDKDFYRHVKSSIVHACPTGRDLSLCKVKMNSNFRMLGRVLEVKLPKCLKCFPKDNNRIRNLEQLNSALDAAVKRRNA